MITSFHISLTIYFNDSDVLKYGPDQTNALHVTVETLRKVIPMMLIDNGFGLNLYPLKIVNYLDLDSIDFNPSDQIIRA